MAANARITQEVQKGEEEAEGQEGEKDEQQGEEEREEDKNKEEKEQEENEEEEKKVLLLMSASTPEGREKYQVCAFIHSFIYI